MSNPPGLGANRHLASARLGFGDVHSLELSCALGAGAYGPARRVRGAVFDHLRSRLHVAVLDRLAGVARVAPGRGASTRAPPGARLRRARALRSLRRSQRHSPQLPVRNNVPWLVTSLLHGLQHATLRGVRGDEDVAESQVDGLMRVEVSCVRPPSVTL